MAGFFEALFKFFTEFTWRKVLVVAVFGVAVLSRLQRAADLLARVQEIEQRATNSSPELDRARSALLLQMAQAVEQQPMSLEFVPSKLTFSIDSLWKFCAGGALWWAFALFQLKKRKTQEEKNLPLGLLVIGIIMRPCRNISPIDLVAMVPHLDLPVCVQPRDDGACPPVRRALCTAIR